uniref:Uncharacterized protein n=1 Tax=Chenopodium quinoa TaxID=63459 RepID=A0A803M0Z9_CHEQI
MPFCPLLKQVTSYLNFLDADFQMLDEPRSIACDIVKADSDSVPWKAVCDLMNKYEIVIKDVTALQKQMYDRSGQLYYFKKEELERIEKGESKVYIHENVSDSFENKSKKIVIDFLDVLRAILRSIDLRCTPIETIEHLLDQYTSWFTVIHHRNSSGFRCLFSDYCASPSATKQNLARKAIDYLIDVFIIQIVDANYRETTCRFDAILYTLERESYLSVKERVLGIKEELEPSANLVEQDCITSVGKEVQVPLSVTPARPSKKRSL